MWATAVEAFPIGLAALAVALSAALCAALLRVRSLSRRLREAQDARAALDSDERRRIEAALKLALLEEQAILDNANVGIEFVRDRRIQRCNRSMEQMLGYGPGELTGQPTRIYYPSDDSWEAHGRLLYPVDGSCRCKDIEWQYQRRDGTLIWCSTRGNPVDPSDMSKGTIWVSIDITARKETETALREAKTRLELGLAQLAEEKDNVELAHRNISVLNEIGREITSTLDRETIMEITYRHVHRLMSVDAFGISFFREDEGVVDCAYTMERGRRCEPYTRDINDSNLLSVWCRRQRAPVFINDLEAEAGRYIDAAALDGLSKISTAYGTMVTPMSVILVPMVVKDNLIGTVNVRSVRRNAYQRVHLDMLLTLAAYAAVALDNADAYRQLQSAQQQLVFQEKMASLGTLTAGVAHEINNPANFAHVGAQTLGQDLERFRRFLLDLADGGEAEVLASLNERIDSLVGQIGTIIEGTTRIKNLVLDLRTFSRLDQAEKKEVHIADSLLSTVNLVRTQYKQVAEIRCDLAANPLLECFPAELNQVFMNLIVNACQAIQSKQRASGSNAPGLLSIRSRTEPPWLVLEFEDDGGGIPPATLKHIFEPFFTTKSVGEGTGMGLSISFGIIEKHQGKIKVSSTEGEGTCFTLTLPLTGGAVE